MRTTSLLRSCSIEPSISSEFGSTSLDFQARQGPHPRFSAASLEQSNWPFKLCLDLWFVDWYKKHMG